MEKGGGSCTHLTPQKVKVCHKATLNFPFQACVAFLQPNATRLLSNIVSHFLFLPSCLCSPQTLPRSESRSQMWKDIMPEGDLFNFERFFGLCFIRSELRGGGSSPKWVAANSAWTLHVGGVEITPPGTS